MSDQDRQGIERGQFLPQQMLVLGCVSMFSAWLVGHLVRLADVNGHETGVGGIVICLDRKHSAIIGNELQCIIYIHTRTVYKQRFMDRQTDCNY